MSKNLLNTSYTLKNSPGVIIKELVSVHRVKNLMKTHQGRYPDLEVAISSELRVMLMLAKRLPVQIEREELCLRRMITSSQASKLR